MIIRAVTEQRSESALEAPFVANLAGELDQPSQVSDSRLLVIDREAFEEVERRLVVSPRLGDGGELSQGFVVVRLLEQDLLEPPTGFVVATGETTQPPEPCQLIDGDELLRALAVVHDPSERAPRLLPTLASLVEPDE